MLVLNFFLSSESEFKKVFEFFSVIVSIVLGFFIVLPFMFSTHSFLGFGFVPSASFPECLFQSCLFFNIFNFFFLEGQWEGRKVPKRADKCKQIKEDVLSEA